MKNWDELKRMRDSQTGNTNGGDIDSNTDSGTHTAHSFSTEHVINSFDGRSQVNWKT